jgi:hypothetical protein
LPDDPKARVSTKFSQDLSEFEVVNVNSYEIEQLRAVKHSIFPHLRDSAEYINPKRHSKLYPTPVP